MEGILLLQVVAVAVVLLEQPAQVLFILELAVLEVLKRMVVPVVLHGAVVNLAKLALLVKAEMVDFTVQLLAAAVEEDSTVAAVAVVITVVHSQTELLVAVVDQV